jgi:WD40 repeat protein
MAVSPDGQWIATSSKGDDNLVLWSTADDRKPAASLPMPGTSDTLAFSPDGRWLAAQSPSSEEATSADSGVISMWSTRDLRAPPRELPEDAAGDRTSLSFSPDGRWLVSGTRNGDVNMWDVSQDSPSAAPRYQCSQGDAVRGRPAFSSDGRYVATATNGYDARLWDLRLPDPCAAPRLLGAHRDAVAAVAFSADSHWAATASFDGTGRLWDITSGAEPTLVAELKFDDRVIQAVFSPDNRWVAFGSWENDNTVKLLDLKHPDAAKPINLVGHADRILAVSFSPDGRWLATASADQTVRLWDPAHPSAAPVILRGHEGRVFDIDFPKDGRWIVTAAYDGTVRLWHLKLDDLIDVACQIAGRQLTAEEVSIFLAGAQPQPLCSGGRPR